jgi:hypothetical protein
MLIHSDNWCSQMRWIVRPGSFANPKFANRLNVNWTGKPDTQIRDIPGNLPTRTQAFNQCVTVNGVTYMCYILSVIHCVSLVILNHLSQFPSPAVGTCRPSCVDAPLNTKQTKSSVMFLTIHSNLNCGARTHKMKYNIPGYITYSYVLVKLKLQ